jgi:deoxyadenosine/deoxycytidine kinase
MEVTVEESIGCGKSTLLRLLSEAKYDVVPEPVSRWQAVLESFYEDPKKYAASMQHLVLSSFLRTGPSRACGITVFERSAFSCLHVFGKLLREDDIMDAVQFEAFRQVFEAMEPHMVSPRVCIYVHLDPDTCAERMRRRGRVAEDDVPVDYLRKLHERYVGFVLEGKVREEDVRFGRQDFRHSRFAEVYVLDGRESQERVAEHAVSILGLLGEK